MKQIAVLLIAVCFLTVISYSEPLSDKIKETKRSLDIKDELFYIRNDTFQANPVELLGQIIVLTANDSNKSKDFEAYKLTGYDVDEKSIIGSPVKRQSLIVNQEVAANIKFLDFISASLSDKKMSSLIVLDQNGARVKQNKNWNNSIKQFLKENSRLTNDGSISAILVVSGFIEKNVISRVFTEKSIFAGVTVYSVNLDNKTYLSSDDYALDMIFGLDLSVIYRAKSSLKMTGRWTTEDEFKIKKEIEALMKKKTSH